MQFKTSPSVRAEPVEAICNLLIYSGYVSTGSTRTDLFGVALNTKIYKQRPGIPTAHCCR